MIDPEARIAPRLLGDLRRTSVDKLGVMFDPEVVERILECIVARIREGTVGDGITHAELVDRSQPYRDLLEPARQGDSE